MSYRPLLAGNIAAIAITLGAFLQLLSWPIAGLIILASLALPILSTINQPKVETDSRPGLTLRDQLRKRPINATAQAQSLAPSVQHEPQHEKKPITSSTNPTLPEQASPTKPTESPTIIRLGDYLTFDLDLESGNRVEGKISASGFVSAYILTEENLTNLDLGQEFWYEAGNEGVQEATLDFTAPEEGSWVLVVENADSKDVFVTVKIRVTQESQGRKPIHGSLTESVPGLTAADNKLESL